MHAALLISIFIAISGLGFNAFGKDKDILASCQPDLETVAVMRAQADAERQAFIAEFADMIFADEAQNQAWIDDALSTPAGTDLHIMIENAWMKKLNDKVFKNKDLVTALTNYHKKLMLEELWKRAPGFKLRPYQDFKSKRLTLVSHRPEDAAVSITEIFAAAKARFYSSDRLKSILRAEDMSGSWFRLGAGLSEGEAALAARDARDHGGAKNASFFWDPSVNARLKTKLESFKNLHAQVLARFSGTTLLKSERDGASLHLDIFAAARKATTADFLATLKHLFPNENLDQAAALLILRYTAQADEFSPSVLVAKRELLSIHDAPYGAISLDFIGLGAENLRATAKALAQAKDLGEAVRLTRAYETEVTKAFVKRKEQVRAAFAEYFNGQVSVRFSGDDGVIIPGRAVEFREQLFLVQKLSLIMPRPFFRMAVIDADGAAYVDSSQLITHGESVEKTMRQILTGTLGGAALGELSIDTFMPDTGKFRKVYLALGAKKQLSRPERAAIRSAFEKAVKIVEDQVRAQGHAIEYEATEAYVIFGKKPY